MSEEHDLSKIDDNQIKQNYAQDLKCYPHIQSLAEHDTFHQLRSCAMVSKSTKAIYPFALNEQEFIIINAHKWQFGGSFIFENIQKYNICENQWITQHTGSHYNFPFDVSGFDKNNKIIYLLELCKPRVEFHSTDPRSLTDPDYVSLIQLNLITKQYVRDKIEFACNTIYELASKAIIIDNKLFVTAWYNDKTDQNRFKLGIFNCIMIDKKINRYDNKYATSVFADFLKWELYSSTAKLDDFELLYYKKNNSLLLISSRLVSFNLKSREWIILLPTLPLSGQKYYQHSFCCLTANNRYILMMGGNFWNQNNNSCTHSDQIHVYDLKTNNLTKSQCICPNISRFMGIMVNTPIQNNLIVFGYIRMQWSNKIMTNLYFLPNYLIKIIGYYYCQQNVYLLDMKNQTQYKISVFDII